MSYCQCEVSRVSRCRIVLPTEVTSNLISYISVTDKESYIEVECDDCDAPIYIKLDYCPMCGRKLKE